LDDGVGQFGLDELAFQRRDRRGSVDEFRLRPRLDPSELLADVIGHVAQLLGSFDRAFEDRFALSVGGEQRAMPVLHGDFDFPGGIGE
jgi:hypothetical protein